MKGNDKVIEVLNEMLADELSAINQYMVHSEMCDSWGYARLHESTEKRAIVEMKHAEKLIGRILYLEGRPVVSELTQIVIGASVKEQFSNDLEAEKRAIAGYNGAIKTTYEAGDHGTRVILESILTDEEDHLDWIETQLEQIDQMGLQYYLVEQTN